ncbi:probable terpene synthase 12 isoform X2 [Syzygium oleosum]|uniref:probable terpene synthase 12 isoform X2 n=1 Tax=Syzygium oleosum TaxID=219896 RepID=UPI0024BADC57|nr:probable terpene synthase 12 isoform X2 [Syzygium oleosum]
MALRLLLAPYLTKLSSPTANGRVHSSMSRQVFDNQGGRRSANYQPTVWTYNYLQSLVADEGGQSRPAEKLQREKAQMVEEEVRGALHDENAEPITIFALVDDIRRLGLGQHFEEDILRALHRCLSPDVVNKSLQKSLHGTALSFRILRQHGFHVSQDVFKIFMDESGNILKTLGNDVQGMLSLHEACNLAIEEEDILHEAKTFAIGHLKNLDHDINKDLQGEVNHELELSLHRRTSLLEARRFIEAYSRRRYTSHRILTFSAMNFNTLQSILQGDLQEMSRWWNNVGLANKLNFARDRLTECFFLAVAVADEPPLSNCRKGLTKVNTLIVILDDVYDIYGTLDELELFTDAVRRWDIKAVEDLPDYMKLCFLALYNNVNEMAYDTLKETGKNAIPYLTKAWYDLCKAFLQEAKWSNNKITPRVEEYLNNGWISSSGHVILTHAYFLSSPSMRKEELESLEHHHDLLRLPSTILRLTNDLATSSAELERGEMTNSIRCYMQEMGVSKSEARKYVIKLIDTVWMKMNKYLLDDSPFNQSFVRMAFNLARMAHCVYHDGDAIGSPDNQSRSRVHSLIIDPISL